jgi:hypothetical protein
MCFYTCFGLKNTGFSVVNLVGQDDAGEIIPCSEPEVPELLGMLFREPMKKRG